MYERDVMRLNDNRYVWRATPLTGEASMPASIITTDEHFSLKSVQVNVCDVKILGTRGGHIHNSSIFKVLVVYTPDGPPCTYTSIYCNTAIADAPGYVCLLDGFLWFRSVQKEAKSSTGGA